MLSTTLLMLDMGGGNDWEKTIEKKNQKKISIFTPRFWSAQYIQKITTTGTGKKFCVFQTVKYEQK